MSAEAEPVVLVDGNNVMRSRWPNIRANCLVGLTRAWADAKGVKAVIVFDGPAPRERTSGIEVFGTHDETADDWIAREAERFFDEGDRVWLVSSDRGLRGRVEPYVERTIGGGAFVSELETLERTHRPSA